MPYMPISANLYKNRVKKGENMHYKTIVTAENLWEKIEYPSGSFPLSIYEDHLDDYLNGEWSYHWHEAFEFGIVLQGKMKGFIHHGKSEQEGQILEAGDGFFVNSRSLHRGVQTEPGTEVFGFAFPADFFSLFPFGEIYRKNVVPVIQSSIAGLFLRGEERKEEPLLSCIRQMQNLDQEDAGYELQCMELICQLWRQLFLLISGMEKFPERSRADRIQDQRLRDMLSYIHSHYSENISINEIAEAANISRSGCFRCFRTVIKKTPAEYLCEYRLSQAAYLLTNTNKTLSEICFLCGFQSTSYFGKVFREYCGMSPGQYRRGEI